MNFSEKLANVVNRYNEVEALIIDPQLSSDELVKMNKELASLTPIVEAIKQFSSLEQNMKDAKEMMNDPSLDTEMKKLAEVGCGLNSYINRNVRMFSNFRDSSCDRITCH